MKHLFSLLLSVASLCSIAQNWEQVGYTINGTSESEMFGVTVDISTDGNTIAVGGHGYSLSGISGAGVIRVYDWNDDFWEQRGDDIYGDDVNDLIGYYLSMSMDGNTIAYKKAYGTQGVQIITWNGSDWIPKGPELYSQAVEFGKHTSYGRFLDLNYDGNTVIIGDPNQGVDTLSGYASVFTWIGNDWVQKGSNIDESNASGPGLGERVGVSSDGNTISVSNPWAQGPLGNDQGLVRVYEWTMSSWEQKGEDIYGEYAGDLSGVSMAMSSDGNTIAVGAYLNDGGNINEGGHVRIHKWNGAEWERKGLDINGSVDGEGLGSSVSLSYDGNIVAIGGCRNWGGYPLFPCTSRGQVYRWNANASAWYNDLEIIQEVQFDGMMEDYLRISADGSRLVIGKIEGVADDYIGSVRVFGNPQPQGVNEPNELAVALSPNPSTGIFTVNVPDQTNIQASVFDALGKLVSTSNETGTFNLDLSEVPVGIYTLRLDTESGTVTKKLVRE